MLTKPANELLPFSEQEFYELRIDDSIDPDRPGFVVMQSRAQWSEIDRQMMWDEIEEEHWITYQAAQNRYERRRQALAARGFTEFGYGPLLTSCREYNSSGFPSVMEVRMKASRLFLLWLLVIALAPATAQTISAADAKNHVGEKATVCGKVAGERTATSSRGEPTFINLDAAYPNQVFTILIWGDDRPNVGTLPSEGSHVCATGMIQEYRGVPEIVVRSSGQLSK